jgi:type IV secretion system protein VirD4
LLLKPHARWLRLMIAQALTDLSRGAVPARPVLFLLDEFAALGRLDPVERAMGLMAGYGVQLWPICRIFTSSARSTASAPAPSSPMPACCRSSASTTMTARKLVSDLLGQETVMFETMSRALDAQETGLSFGVQHVGRPLLTPDEVRTLRPDLQLLLLAGQRPIVATKLAYYADREFAGNSIRSGEAV